MLLKDQSATIDACRFCFMCRHVCTMGVTSGKESDTPRGKGLLLFKILNGHLDYSDDVVETLYRCCLCGLCQTWCKAGFTPPAAVLAARADLVEQGRAPERVRQIHDALQRTGNPFGLPAEERLGAIDASGLFRPGAEVLYYVGCDAAYQRPEIAKAMIAILREARVDFSLLSGETSTGKPLWLLGYRDDARAMAGELVRKIRSTQCRVVVTTCPSSYDALASDYPAMGLDLGIEVVHAATYVDRLLQEKRLTPRKDAGRSVTLLDGTYLGRSHGIYEEPRRVLGRIPGARLREMPWSRELVHSCGESGGVFRLLHPESSRALARRVLVEAAHSGAEVLATTCPVTKTALLEADPAGRPVADLVELVAGSL